MRAYIAAGDVQPGDILADVGMVGAVNVVGDEVTFTMRWSETVVHALALDDCVWIDRDAAK